MSLNTTNQQYTVNRDNHLTRSVRSACSSKSSEGSNLALQAAAPASISQKNFIVHCVDFFVFGTSVEHKVAVPLLHLAWKRTGNDWNSQYHEELSASSCLSGHSLFAALATACRALLNVETRTVDKITNTQAKATWFGAARLRQQPLMPPESARLKESPTCVRMEHLRSHGNR